MIILSPTQFPRHFPFHYEGVAKHQPSHYRPMSLYSKTRVVSASSVYSPFTHFLLSPYQAVVQTTLLNMFLSNTGSSSQLHILILLGNICCRWQFLSLKSNLLSLATETYHCLVCLRLHRLLLLSLLWGVPSFSWFPSIAIFWGKSSDSSSSIFTLWWSHPDQRLK